MSVTKLSQGGSQDAGLTVLKPRKSQEIGGILVLLLLWANCFTGVILNLQTYPVGHLMLKKKKKRHLERLSNLLEPYS